MTETSEAGAPAKWTTRLGGWAWKLGILAYVLALGGSAAARGDVISKMSGLSAILGGSAVALVGVVIALAALVLAVRHKASLVPALIGLVLTGSFATFAVSRAVIARSVMPIHDITTDLQDPPTFSVLPLRADNLDQITDLGRADLKALPPLERWKALHRMAYPDLKPLVLQRSVEDVIADAQKLAVERGWKVAVADPAEGRLEATASVSFIKFEDDVVLRVRPEPDGQGSRVDMRSVSRIGVSDLGVNAKRVRDFLADLQAQ